MKFFYFSFEAIALPFLLQDCIHSIYIVAKKYSLLQMLRLIFWFLGLSNKLYTVVTAALGFVKMSLG
jgi:hypothetical protein